jgi:hypothetical protein
MVDRDLWTGCAPVETRQEAAAALDVEVEEDVDELELESDDEEDEVEEDVEDVLDELDSDATEAVLEPARLSVR